MAAFVAIDFETANNRPNSACQLGLVVVEDWTIVEEAVWLIRPPRMFFSANCVRVHGLTARDCMNSPNWSEIWGNVRPYLEGRAIVGHNVGFDASVLLGCCQHYEVALPEHSIQCSRLIAKKAWPAIDGHGLANVANHLGIEFRHHDALEDARTCAKIVIQAAEKLEVESFTALEETLGLIRGRIQLERVRNPRSLRIDRSDQTTGMRERVESKLFRSDGTPQRVVADRKAKLAAQTIKDRCNGSKPLENKHMVLVNSILGLPREDAMSLLSELGAVIQPQINLRTQFVILGTPPTTPKQHFLFDDIETSETDTVDFESDSEDGELRAVQVEIEKRKSMGQPLYALSPRQLLAMIPAAAQVVRGE